MSITEEQQEKLKLGLLAQLDEKMLDLQFKGPKVDDFDKEERSNLTNDQSSRYDINGKFHRNDQFYKENKSNFSDPKKILDMVSDHSILEEDLKHNVGLFNDAGIMDPKRALEYGDRVVRAAKKIAKQPLSLEEKVQDLVDSISDILKKMGIVKENEQSKSMSEKVKDMKEAFKSHKSQGTPGTYAAGAARSKNNGLGV